MNKRRRGGIALAGTDTMSAGGEVGGLKQPWGVWKRVGAGSGGGAAAGPGRPLAAWARTSDAEPADCGELRFVRADEHEQLRQFKAPSPRNVAERAPYMHAGQFNGLREALEHYHQAPRRPPATPSSSRLA